MTKPLIITCMRGLGDNIYARPFIRAAATRHAVFLDTPWPELFEDLPVQFLEPKTRLRTQQTNIDRQPAGRWVLPPADASRVNLQYGPRSIEAYGSMTKALEKQLPLDGCPYIFDLPAAFDSYTPDRSRRLAFVRPVTLRSEWRNEARNPDPAYIEQIAADLRSTHGIGLYADLKPSEEWLVGKPPQHDLAFLYGSTIKFLLRALSASSIALGGVGWLVPAAIALGVPAFIVLGGQGAFNAPEIITDPRMDLSKIHFAVPRDFCRCRTKQHNCSKMIPDLMEQWRTFKRTIYQPYLASLQPRV